MKKFFIVGPPGSGKIAAARALHREHAPAFADDREAVESAWIGFGSGIESPLEYAFDVVPRLPRFRAPHHTVSAAGLVGTSSGPAYPFTLASGNRWTRPGEASLAHGGTLILDEVLEFRTAALEEVAAVLRYGTAPNGLPARPRVFILTANLCGCGWLRTPRPCTCSGAQSERYQNRLADVASLFGVEALLTPPMIVDAEARAS